MKRELIRLQIRDDAAEIAIDKDGNLYFSLGCMSYNKAWSLDERG